VIAEPRANLEALRQAATAGILQLSAAPPASDEAIRARENGLEPHFGSVTWSAPPSYRMFLAEHNRLLCRRTVGDNDAEFVIVNEEEMVPLNQTWVHLPEHVSRDPGRYLSTNHLVGFAYTVHDEAVWCFDVTEPDANGEYPVYYHHEDEPRARYLDDDAWEDPDDAVPDFPSFAAWLTAMTQAFTATEPPDWIEELGSPAMVWVGRSGRLRQPPPK
jgi:hypothetical protein